MSSQCLSVNIQSGTGAIFSQTYPVVDNGKNNAGLVLSLKKAQAGINQFLTELVAKSGSQDVHQGQNEEVSDDDDDDDEEEEDQKDEFITQAVAVKRKGDSNGTNPPSDKQLGKKLKPRNQL